VALGGLDVIQAGFQFLVFAGNHHNLQRPRNREEARKYKKFILYFLSAFF
jgi:hypothetical protein